MKSLLFRLDKNDFAKGLVMAFLAPILVFLASALQVPGFTFSSLDFSMLVHIGMAAGLTYLVKNFFSTPDGKVGGIIG